VSSPASQDILCTAVIDRTALFVARSANPPQFEDKIREGQRSDPKFSFLNPADPYHGYYRHKMDKIAQGDLGDDPEMKDEKGEGDSAPKQVVDIGVEPPQPAFIMEMPHISSIDLYVLHASYILYAFSHFGVREIMKVTALFTARRGRIFLANLSAREGRNYQFDFLRPTHSLFGYFNRLVEQYTKVLHPDKETLEQLKQRAQKGARWQTLEFARKYGKWERNKREKNKKREDDQEAERSACSFFSSDSQS
jgi:splicing factor 3A subunit 1